MHTPHNTNPAIVSQFLTDYSNDIKYFYEFGDLTKIEDYLYSINYNSIDYEAGAQFYAVSMIYDAYFTMNKDEWISQDNKEYRDATEKRFSKYYREFKFLFDGIDKTVKTQIVMGIKNRMYQEGLLMESKTFDDWIKEVMNKYGTAKRIFGKARR